MDEHEEEVGEQYTLLERTDSAEAIEKCRQEIQNQINIVYHYVSSFRSFLHTVYIQCNVQCSACRF